MRRRDFAYATSVGLLSLYLPRRLEAAAPCPPPTLEVEGGETAGTTCSTGAVPSWYSSLAHKQWASPVSNTFATPGILDPNAEGANRGNTGPESIFWKWTGMVCDSQNKEIVLMANGGHNDYHGNEVYSCDLSAATPAWQRRRNASIHPSGAGSWPVQPDGRPGSDHTANLPVAAEGRWFLPGMTAVSSGGNSARNQWWEFSRSSNDWINLGNSHPSGGGALQVYGTAACWDPGDRQIIVGFLSGDFSVLFQNIGAMSAASPAVINDNNISWSGGDPYMTLAVDTTNRVLFCHSEGNAPKFLRINSTANKQAAWTNLTGTTGTPPDSSNAVYWHPPSNAFITWDNSGQSLRKYVPTVSGGTYTGGSWQAVSTGFSGVTPPAAVNGGTPNSANFRGMFSKIQLMAMADGTHALIVVPRYSTNAAAQKDVYVCRLTGSV